MGCWRRSCVASSPTCNIVYGMRRKEPFIITCLHKSPSFSTVKICIRSNNNTSKSKPPTSSSTSSPSFLHNLYNEAHLILQTLHGILFTNLPILLPRIIALVATLQLTSEYGFKTVTCEGPSMEPTIIDGSYTCVLIERWSHRLFGLEKDVGHIDETNDTTEEGKNCKDNSDEESGNSVNSWYAVFRGIWKQHIASGLQRGDVIILYHPSKEATICKRIIGMPGDRIVRTDGDPRHLVVPPGHLWIEGDNARNSLDSRSYGTVSASLVIGTVICRLWPLREYISLGMDANGIEHWRRIDARIGRGERPLIGNNKGQAFNGKSYVLANEAVGEKKR